MTISPLNLKSTRIGFHYFPDTHHFREDDLSFWVPELKSLGCSWLTVLAPSDRAIPEHFLTGLFTNGIEPILQFHLPLEPPPQVNTLKILIETYARWGIQYVVIFDQPNNRSAWSSPSWMRSDLVERFLDRFIPFADLLIDNGIYPIFPPLTPGGDYWDTSFLRFSLQGLERRAGQELLESLIIGAYARAGDHPLTWGQGGPERWPSAKPYYTPDGSQDQRGFCIFEWYLSISEATIGKRCPMILFGLESSTSGYSKNNPSDDLNVHRTLAMAESLLLRRSSINQTAPTIAYGNELSPLPDEIIAGNFWLLSAEPDSTFARYAWYLPGRENDPRALALKKLLLKPQDHDPKSHYQNLAADSFKLKHYLLLPSQNWGAAEYYLNLARPFIRREKPVIGFSIEEARHAHEVTVLGDNELFPEMLLDDLRQAGCFVRRINPDGTNIALILDEHKAEAFDG